MINLLKYSAQLSQSAFLVGICFYSLNAALGTAVKANELEIGASEAVDSLLAQAQPRTKASCLQIENPEERERCINKTPTFFEESRPIQPGGFKYTFVNDALNGVSDPLNGLGGTASQLNTPIAPNRDSISPPNVAKFLDGQLNVDVTVEQFGPTRFGPTQGIINFEGDFTFSTADVPIPPGFSVPSIPNIPIQFNVGTTQFAFNDSILVTDSFIRAVRSNTAVQSALQNLGIQITSQDESNIQSATVTPVPPPGIDPRTTIHTVPGGFVFGTIPDR